MKNPKVEALRLAAKRYHRSHYAGHFTNGVRSYHRYDHRSANDLSWWDDSAFVLNDYLVHLAWVHPRMVFKDKIAYSHQSCHRFAFQNSRIFAPVARPRELRVLRVWAGN